MVSHHAKITRFKTSEALFWINLYSECSKPSTCETNKNKNKSYEELEQGLKNSQSYLWQTLAEGVETLVCFKLRLQIMSVLKYRNTDYLADDNIEASQVL